MEENPRIDIVYGDVLLPQLYEHSQISSEQLPGKPGNIMCVYFMFIYTSVY